jgi:hypothetical protein
MAIEQKLKTLSMQAGADLSAKQYTFVKLNSSGKVVTCGDDERGIGVLQDKPASDKGASVATTGITKMTCAAAITNGAAVTSDANGKAVAATTGKHIMGFAMETGANNRIIAILLDRVGAF